MTRKIKSLIHICNTEYSVVMFTLIFIPSDLSNVWNRLIMIFSRNFRRYLLPSGPGFRNYRSDIKLLVDALRKTAFPKKTFLWALVSPWRRARLLNLSSSMMEYFKDPRGWKRRTKEKPIRNLRYSVGKRNEIRLTMFVTVAVSQISSSLEFEAAYIG